jgi:lipopolysaccharide/colanic/teichoic acid biosynthesis glycosyltransferase
MDAGARMVRTKQQRSTSPRARGKLYKRPFDLAVIVLAHLLLLPLWILLWGMIPLLIWLEDRGPIFYPQRRVGQDGRVFTILKFRTLVQNADKTVRAWTVPDQRYVTRIGHILRSTALDELPQVLNILTGDMSFVGPRAMPFDEFQEFRDKIPGLEQRLAVRPGLTGMAQVYGEGVRDAREKLRYDLDYVQRMSLLLDVKLMLLSVRNTVLARWDKEGRSPTGGLPDSGNGQAGLR